MRASVALGLALVVVLLAYAEAPFGGFVWDDVYLIRDHPVVTQLQPLSTYFTRSFWAERFADQPSVYYRPLVTLSYALEHRLWGGAPGGFHATNVLLHLVVCGLIFLASRRAGASTLAAGLATAVFGSLPRLAESVAWISGRTDVMGAIGGLAAYLLWTRPHATTRARVFAAVFLLAGLLSKEVAAAALPAIVLHDVLRHGTGSWGHHLRRWMPLAIASITYAALRLHAMVGEQLGDVEPFPDLGFVLRTATILQAIGAYAWMLVDPFQTRLHIGVLGAVEPAFLFGGVLVLVLVALALVRLRAHRLEPFAAGMLVLGLSAIGLVLQIVPLRLNVIAADRFLYVPAAAVAVLAAGYATRLSASRQKWVGLAGALLLVPLVLLTRERTRDWSEELRLWSRGVETGSRQGNLAASGMGEILLERHRPEEALAFYRQALEERTMPRPGALTNMALALQQMGRADEAITLFEEAVELRPKRQRYRFNLAMARLRQLAFDDAEARLRTLQQEDPNDPLPQQLLDLVSSTRSEWQSLAARSDTTPVTLAERARLHARIGAVFEANALWRKVATTPGAAEEDVREALAYLVVHAPRPDATAALSALAARDADEALLIGLNEELIRRFGRE